MGKYCLVRVRLRLLGSIQSCAIYSCHVCVCAFGCVLFVSERLFRFFANGAMRLSETRIYIEAFNIAVFGTMLLDVSPMCVFELV